jgi:predicted  nucleic acid-binding Zn-ribbon protein
MARVESLELLNSVINDLEPIGQMTTGNPLRAADWNSMVGAVRNLARLIVSREKTTDALLDERYATRNHNHSGQMTLAWFEPGARTLLDEAMTGSVEQRAAVTELRKEMAALRQDMALLKNQMENIRIQFDGLRDEDASRQREMNQMAVRVEGLVEVGDDLAELNTRFTGIGARVEEALAFREQLVDENGEPIDMAGFNTRINELEDMRNNLRTADGNIVNIRVFESTLTRLEENSINRNDVDDVILQRLREGGILDEAGLVDSVTTRIQDNFTEQFDSLINTTNTLGSQITALDARIIDHSNRLDDVEDGVSSALTSLGTMTGLPSQVTSQGTRLSTVETRVQNNQAAIADLPTIRSRLTTVENQVSVIDNLSATINGLSDRVEIAESNLGQIDILSSQVSTLGSRVGDIEQSLPNITDLQQQVATNSSDIQNVSQRVSANEAELDNLAGITEQMASLSKTQQEIVGWQVTVDKRLDDLSIRVNVNTTLASRVNVLESTVAENSTVVRQLNQTVTGIQNVLPGLQALPDQIKTINTRLSTVERRVPVAGGGTVIR